jgi:hypothetical protein
MLKPCPQSAYETGSTKLRIGLRQKKYSGRSVRGSHDLPLFFVPHKVALPPSLLAGQCAREYRAFSQNATKT